MNPTSRNFAVFAVALLASSVLAGSLNYFWHALLINDRTFTVYLELISVATLMNWFFYFIYFFATGFLLSLALVTKRAWLWGLSLGVCYSLLRCFLGQQWFAPDAGFYVYFAHIGEYLMPAFGGLLGAFLLGHFRTRAVVPN